jgi:RimJ/RimL family protein N-acetyltransferase
MFKQARERAAHHVVRNQASGRMLAKIDVKQEGLLRQRV